MTIRQTFQIALAVTILTSAMARADAPTTQPHTLPANAQTPVITLDRTGGGPDRKNADPIFQVLSDGTAIVGNPYGNERSVKGKLSPDQLQNLLHFILDDVKFDEITSDDLAIKSKSEKPVTVTISVDADGTDHQVTAALSLVRGLHRPPTRGSPRDRFFIVEHRLQAVRAVVLLGGDDAVKKLLVVGNATLKIRFPDEKAMETSDLTSAIGFPDGSNRATFSRKAKQSDGGWYQTTVDVTDDGKGPPKVDVDKAPAPWQGPG